MTYTNCPHCGSLFSTRGLYRHIESKHPEYTKDFKHGLTIKITDAQRTALKIATNTYNLSFDNNITPEEFVVAYLEARGIIKA